MSGVGGPLNCRVMLQGQSNCYGVGAISELALLPDSELTSLAAAPFERVFIMNAAGTAYEPLQIGVNNQAVTAKFGPEFGLAVRWTRETSRGNLYIDKQYRDGQAIATFQDGASGGFFTGLKTKRAAMNSWLAARGITVSDVGWLWVQGESDAAQTEAYYLDQLETYVSSMLASAPLLLPPNAKRILAQMRVGTTYYSAAIVAAKAAYVAAHQAQGRLVAMSANMNGDNLHLNARGQLQLAYDTYSALFNRPLIAA